MKRGKEYLASLALMIGLGAIVACGGTQLEGESTSQFPSTPVESVSTSKLNEAPDFEFTLYQGETELGANMLKFSDIQGSKPIVLNFWAGLCPPCRAEIPDLQEFIDEFGDRIILLGMDIGRFTNLGSTEDAIKLLDELNVTYPSGYPLAGSSVINYKVLGMPTTVFVTADGKIFQKWTGTLNRDVLAKISNEMLQAQVTP